MTQISVDDIKRSFPSTKCDMWWVRLWVRRVSFFVAWAFLRLKWSPNQVSYLALAVAAIACVFLASSIQAYRVLGAILLNVWLILDCADGNMARVLGRDSRYGDFIDAVVGYVAMAGALISSGIGVLVSEGSNPPLFSRTTYGILGSVAATAAILARLIHQKFVVSSLLSGARSDRSTGSNPIKRLDLEVGFSGLFMPLVVVGTWFDILYVVPLFYSAYGVLGLAGVLVWYIRKAEGSSGPSRHSVSKLQ